MKQRMMSFLMKEIEKDHKFNANLWRGYEGSVSSKTDHFSFVTFEDWKKGFVKTFIETSIINYKPMTVSIGLNNAELYVNEKSIEDVSKAIYEQFKEKFSALYYAYR